MTLYYDFDDDNYEYEPDTDEAEDYVIGQFAFDYSIPKDAAKYIAYDFDLMESLVDDTYYDSLKDYFEDKAHEEYLDNKEYERDPLGYVGMSENDFIDRNI